MLDSIPIVVRLDAKRVHTADLLRELRVDKFHLEREILEQAGKYAWWATLYAEVEAKCELLREKLEGLEARLAHNFVEGSEAKHRVTDVKYYVRQNGKYATLRRRLRHWENALRTLKYAEKAWMQRAGLLQTYSANQRQDKKGETE